MKRYWKIVSPEIIKELRRIKRKNDKAEKALGVLAGELDATDSGWSEGLFQSRRHVAFKFATSPDRKLWKTKDGEWWMPKASAKELNARCQAIVAMCESTESVAKLIGIGMWFEAFALCTPRFHCIKGQWYFRADAHAFSGNANVERVSDIEIESLFSKKKEVPL